MVRVPLAENTVGIAQPTDARVEAPDMGQGGEMIGRALDYAGSQMSGLADTLNQVGKAQDNAATKEAVNGVNAQVNSVLSTGDDPYFNKLGKSALEARPGTDKAIADAIAAGRKGLRTPKQQQLFDDALADQRVSWGVQVANHAYKQAFQYDDDASAARAAQAGENAVVNYADPKESRKQIDTGIAEIEHRGSLNGWSPEKTTTEKLKFTNSVHQDVGTQLAYSGDKGPQLAEAYGEQHRSELTGDGYQAILTHARVQQNALDAEQRRAEADQRRELHDQQKDARDRAESVYRNLQDHVVVDPKTLAGAINDARSAGDAALVEGIRQSGLKNNLTQQWAKATPAEMQARVDELSADITKAGGQVDPDKMVERDTLQDLVTKSRSQLSTDPLSWGAAHMGIQLQPLNLNDPASVRARNEAAIRIASRTGTTPKPLTQDEVAASQQTLYHGTTQDKIALAMRVARLGALAIPAAEQLSNNPGWTNLIGLATHSNAGVAASRVNQVLTGQEVLRTKPKLIDKNQAQQQLDAYTGSAFQFLPQVKAGVMANAQALLASEANEHGWNEWRDADPRAWYRSVNSALGAYTRDGKQVGGLAGYNGAITVLPENMSLDEFEGRIAKSNGPQFQRAQNGIPVRTDGSSPSATDLKRMQWVPSGDGIYRLSDGNGFLKTKGGGFYEVDVTKLPVGAAPPAPGSADFNAQLAAHGYYRH